MTHPGVLALQGDVREHIGSFSSLGVEAVPVRTPRDLDGVDRLVIPGGESTTMAYLLGTSGLRGPLGDRLAAGMPIFGTCAGLIMLAAHIDGGRSDQWSYGALDVTVRRNGYGRQVASFEAFVDAPNIGLVPGVFIRAPRVTTWGDDVEVLATYDHGDGSHPVLMRQGGALGCSFHPELTDSTSIHRYFLDSFD